MKKDDTDLRQLVLDLTCAQRETEYCEVANLRDRVAPLAGSQVSHEPVSVPEAEVTHTVSVAVRRVVPFLDATTIALRRNAVHRVQLAGIFATSPLIKR